MGYSVRHNQKLQKFYINIGNREAFLKYEKVNDGDEGVLDLRVLFVPKNLRGMGIAEKVLIKALSYADNHNFKVLSDCNYISTFFESHPEIKDIISERPEVFTWILHYN